MQHACACNDVLSSRVAGRARPGIDARGAAPAGRRAGCVAGRSVAASRAAFGEGAARRSRIRPSRRTTSSRPLLAPAKALPQRRAGGRGESDATALDVRMRRALSGHMCVMCDVPLA
ncbi:hypothetical protein WT60_26770 [Burkholderia sp. MSMB617WGS]|nr:hypothetical protein WT60_26770 [Burkholderia sp. MSMB617WGS]